MTADAEGEDAGGGGHDVGQGEVEDRGVAPQVVGTGLPHDAATAQHLQIEKVNRDGVIVIMLSTLT